MTDNSIHFDRNGKKIYLDEGKSYKKAKKELKDLQPIFDAIDEVGNKKGKVDGKETELLNLLRGKLGKYISEDSMKKLVEDFQKSGKSIEEFLKDKAPTSGIVHVVESKEYPNPVEMIEQILEEDDATAEETSVADGVTNDVAASEPKASKPTPEKVADDGKSSMRAYNNTIQNLKQKYGDKKDALNGEFAKTYTVKKGDSLYKIAVEQLKAENGGKKPGYVEINKRIAEIALVNNINDVNKVKVGQELKVGKTPAPADTTVQTGAQQDVKPEIKPNQEPEPPVAESSIVVVKPQIDENWTEAAVEGEEKIKKFTKTEGEGENAVTTTKFKYTNGDIAVEADTLEELKELIKPFEKEIKSAPESEAAEAATARKAENLKTLLERVKTYPSEEVLKDVVATLKDEGKIDKTSDEAKALVKDLLLTKNNNVIEAIIINGEGGLDNTLFEKDEEALKTAADMYKELIDKEKAGVRLTDDERGLKSLLQEWPPHYDIPADAEHGVVAKSEGYSDRGILYKAGDYSADSPELLDAFVTKLNAADTDEKKAALFKEYANTDDIGLARALARNAHSLKATKDDVLALINKNDMALIAQLSYIPEEVDNDAFCTAIKDRIEDIYLKSDRGNIENTKYLATAFDRIYTTNMTEEEKSALKNQILETYFVVETAKDEEGNDVKTYKFEPSRRYTYNEMRGLIGECDDDMKTAIANSIKLEDMGLNEYTAAVEEYCSKEVLVPKFAEFIDKMETKEDVLDFINNKVRYWSDIPFDKIIEKFSAEPEVMQSLLEKFYEDCIISEENGFKLAKFFTQTDENGNVTFDKSKLPEGVTLDNFVQLLPADCQEGEAQKVARAIYEKLDLDDGEAVLYMFNNINMGDYNKNVDKLVELAKQTDKVGNAIYNRVITHINVWEKLPDNLQAEIYEKSSTAVKRQLIEGNGYNKAGQYVVVKAKDSVDKIIKDYLRANLDKFPRLKTSVENNPNKWTDDRIEEALNDYMQDFREAIMQDLGITAKIKVGDVIDLSKVNWDAHQPGWWKYNLFY